MSDEFDFIHRIQPINYNQTALRKGIGDDAAVFRQSYQDIVVAKDMFVDRVHFARNTMNPFHIGYKSLAANISDVAAMGAKPAFYLVAISIPNNWSTIELEEIYDGMKDIAKYYNMDLIGGDTVSGDVLTISVTVIGFVEPSKIRYRNLAKEGDIVFVTGTLGDSQAGFYILNHPSDYNGSDYFIRRHQMPTPRVEFASALSSITRVCLNDISDGIASEANEIAEASNITMILEDGKIPVHPYIKQFSLELQTKWKLYGGEDFELIGTVSKKDWPIVEQAAQKTNTKLTAIGHITTSEHVSGKVLLENKGRQVILEKKGYNHLRR